MLFDGKPSFFFSFQESFKFYADKLKERADKAQMRAEE